MIDSNDHRPVFFKNMYNINVSESIEVGTQIIELTATDEDEDNKVFYSLHSSRNPVSLELFKINSLSGRMKVSAPLDRLVYLSKL